MASAAGSVSMVVVVVAMRRVEALVMERVVVVVKACTGHPRRVATGMMVMVKGSQETPAPAMEESRPGLPDSVSLHVMFL